MPLRDIDGDGKRVRGRHGEKEMGRWERERS